VRLVVLTASDQPRRHGARLGLRLAGNFATAARAAAESGIDVLELDVADDPRATLRAFDAARGVWPMARPIAVRLAAGEDVDALVELARVLAARGCDLLSLAAGRDAAADLAAIALSDRIRHEAGIPTLVGARARIGSASCRCVTRNPRRSWRAATRSSPDASACAWPHRVPAASIC